MVPALISLSLFCVIFGTLIFVQLMRVTREYTRAAERTRNQHAARENELLDRIMHQQGRTWTPPPRPALVEDDEPTEEGWTQV
jgi:hypothetical protein